MNTNQTFTAADVAELADTIQPHLARIANDGMNLTDTVTAAVLLAKQDAEKAESRHYTQLHIFTDALSGTYEEFRAEAAAAA